MKEIIKIIREKKYLKKYNNRDSYISNLIIASTYSGLEISESNIAELDSMITDGSNDGGCDVFIEKKEKDNKYTYNFIQVTDSPKGNNPKIREAIFRLDKIFTLFQKSPESFNSKITKILSKILERKEKDPRINFVVVSNNEDVEVITKLEIQNLNQNSQKNINYIFINKKERERDCVYWFTKKIPSDKLINKTPSMYFPKYSYELATQKSDEIAIVIVSAASIAVSVQRAGVALFEENVRFFLKLRNKINKNIYKTLESEKAQKFIKFNNGLTVLCSSYVISKLDNSLTLWDAQIINGAQTSSTITQAFEDGVDLTNVNVSLKIMVEKDLDDRKLISKYSNSQTAINGRDLLSNTEEQKEMQNQFLKQNILLEIKKGEFSNNKFSSIYENISNEQVAQMYIANFLKKPHIIKNKKSEIFDIDKTLYSSIFIESEFNDVWKSFLVFKQVEKIVASENLDKKTIAHLSCFVFGQLWNNLKEQQIGNSCNKFIKNNVELLTQSIKEIHNEIISNAALEFEEDSVRRYLITEESTNFIKNKIES